MEPIGGIIPHLYTIHKISIKYDFVLCSG